MLIRRIKRFRMDMQLALALFLTAMNKLLANLRLYTRLPALVLLLAILAPVFMAALPAPALSAERQLLADIAKSLGYEVMGIDLFRTRLATATKVQLREEVVLLQWPG